MSAMSMAKALSQPKSRSVGRSEKEVTARPQARTIEVTISAGPMRTVARSTAMAGSSPGRDSRRMRLRKWIVALKPKPKETVKATTLAKIAR